ncbi:MAG TPA: molybdopterin molybdotransferase MoeA [Acidobacteriota bacterium]|nr:molybdopterin molybdotransferase MoeA [Acidobacteriota bacterium]
MDRISYSESLRILRAHLERLHGVPERVAVRESLRRILFSEVRARRANPPDALAAMDGIAVDARSASVLPAVLPDGAWQRINTGEAVPPKFNAVVRIEDVRWDREQPIVEKAISYFQNIRPAAEDFRSDDLLFAAEHEIEPPDLAFLLAAGISEVEVFRKPVVTFIPTGSELVRDPSTAGYGQVPESNSAMIAGLVAEWGGTMRLHDPVPDEPEALKAGIRSALSCSDILVLSAGTSMGTRDFTAEICRTLGTLLFHGVAIHPARPVLFAQMGDVPVLGLPGYPSAAYLAATLYLRQLVTALSGCKPRMRQEVYISAEDIPARKEDSFYRVQCFDVDGRVYSRRIQRGSGSVRAISQMDGWMHVPPGTEIHKRDAVRIDLIQDRTARVIAIRGANHPYAGKLFDLFHTSMPSHRILFWESQPEEALESIIERNAHMALLSTRPRVDLFPAFSNRLRDPVLRYRLFSRTVSLLLRPKLAALPAQGASIAVPEGSLHLWQDYLDAGNMNSANCRIEVCAGSEEQLARTVDSNSWDAVFADTRFLGAGAKSQGHVSEHYDLVVSESHLESDPAIRHLIDLALSPEYEEWLGRQGAYDPAARGLM